MSETISAVMLGAIEGLTEFLPISSTAHLILASRLIGLAQDDFQKSFEIIVQMGAILAVVFLYWRTLILDTPVLKRVVVAFLPTGVIGLTAYRTVKTHLLSDIPTVLTALFIGGAAMVVFEMVYTARRRKVPPGRTSPSGVVSISWRHCLILGVIQSLAMIPGVSRAAATILGGLALGLNRKTIVEFSFLLAVPTMLAATGLDLVKSAGGFDPAQMSFLAIGFITAFLTALVSIKWLLSYIGRHDFRFFGFYRMAVAAALVAAAGLGWLTL